MAQWNGQYREFTRDESMLEHAVEVFDSCDEVQKVAKGKSVKKLASKVFNARRKIVRRSCMTLSLLNQMIGQRDKFKGTSKGVRDETDLGWCRWNITRVWSH